MNASSKLAWGLALPLFVAGCPTADTDKSTDTDVDTDAETDTQTETDVETDVETDTETDVEPTCGDDIVNPGLLCFTTSDVSNDEAVGEVAVGDFDGGNPDVVYTTATSSLLGYRSGDGAGGLAASSTIDTELGDTLGLQLAHLDSGSNLDVVIKGQIYFGDGAGGTATNEGFYATEGDIWGIHVGEIAGSSASADIVIAADYSGVIVTSGLEGEGFVQEANYNGTNAVAGALIAHTTGGSAVVWIVSDGEGGSSTTLRMQPLSYADTELTTGDDVDATIQANAFELAVGDLNGDDLDEVIVATTAGRVNVLFSDGLGGWVDQSGSDFVGYAAGSNPTAVALGDVDGDGDLDVVVANGSADAVTVLVNDGSGTLTASEITLATGAAPSNVATGDLNGDGVDDIVLATAAPEELTLLLSNP